MAKSIRSKVKKRLRSVKRGVVKRESTNPASKLGTGPASVKEKLAEASSGYIKPGTRLRNAFRYDDEEATIPQHNWRQGPDFRASTIGAEAGYALVGARRPKKGNRGGDAPSSTVSMPEVSASNDGDEAMESETAATTKAKVDRLQIGSEQYLPFRASRKQRRKVKNKSGIDHNVFRWT